MMTTTSAIFKHYTSQSYDYSVAKASSQAHSLNALPDPGPLPCAKDTRQKGGSPSGAHGKDPTATLPTANTLFAVCPLSGTRHRLHCVFLTTHDEKK